MALRKHCTAFETNENSKLFLLRTHATERMRLKCLFYFTISFDGTARSAACQRTMRLAVENNLEQKTAEKRAYFTRTNNVLWTGLGHVI